MRKTVAVDDLSFTIPEGQVTAFLGSNGAGKTTTIQTVLNLHHPTDGNARLFGIDSRKSGPSELRKIGYVSENMELPLWMTVEQYHKYCRPFYPTWDDDFCVQLMEEFQLPADRKLRNLSRGMRMKAALIGGIAYRPKLVILDVLFFRTRSPRSR
ncbi:ABC transporter ATP-binding protein [Verrucomicrobiales bacterium]|nr:ABC transporter ATP-binding protein [Verrucomicrobiales bacterium]